MFKHRYDRRCRRCQHRRNERWINRAVTTGPGNDLIYDNGSGTVDAGTGANTITVADNTKVTFMHVPTLNPSSVSGF